MFEAEQRYPVAVASSDDEGVDAAINWCVERMEDGDILSVWTSLKGNLRNSQTLEQLVRRYKRVTHIVGRGVLSMPARGPVLMAWADLDDIARLVRAGGRRITALCVISWNDDWLRPWVAESEPEVLGDGSAWADLAVPQLDPLVVEALDGLTHTINHNNTISGGYEKDSVVSVLLALHDGGIPMDADAMQAWVVTHGWSGGNPGLLAGYVRDIQAGKRPRARRSVRSDYLEVLRSRVVNETGA